METQKISEAQEPQKTHEPEPKEPQIEEPQKKKNPISVAAGKKGAEARWNKHKQAQQAPQAQAEHELIRITKEPPPQERPPTVNVYKNFFPLCVLIGAGLGVEIFMIYGRKTEMQPKIQPKIQPEIKQRPIDPFEMR